MGKKLLAIVGTMLLLILVMIGWHEIARKINKDKHKATDTDAATENNLDLYYSYGDVEARIERLATDATKREALSRLIDPLNRSGKVNVSCVRNMCSIIGAPESLYADIIFSDRDDDYVTKEQFDRIYDNIMHSDAVEGLSCETVYVFGINDEGTKLSDGRNAYDLDTEIPESYFGKLIDVYVNNDTVFEVRGPASSEASVCLEYVLVTALDDQKCTFLYGGRTVEQSLMPTTSISKIEEVSDGKDVSSATDATATDATATDAVGGIERTDIFLADLTVTNDGIRKIEKRSASARARVMGVSDGSLVIENRGARRTSGNIQIYNVLGEPAFESSLPSLAGYESVELFEQDGEIRACVIDREMKSDTIRVLLSDSEDDSYELPTVICSSEGDYKVYYPDGKIITHDATEKVTLDYKKFKEGDTIRIVPLSDAKLTVETLSRSYGAPSYEGTLEAIVSEKGFHLINELPLETYLYYVVPSEMPADAGDEALKAMAICSRGYAVMQMRDVTYGAYGAHIDDTTMSQVYNNVLPSERTIRAVKDTYGIVPTYKGELIKPYYYSTSGGVSCTNAEIWEEEAYPYFEVKTEEKDRRDIDLSDETLCKNFIDNSSDYAIIDKDMPFYRWQVSYTNAEMTEAIKRMLPVRMKRSPNGVRKLSEDDLKQDPKQDSEADAPEEANEDEQRGEILEDADIGTIKSVKVSARYPSGTVKALLIEGSKATVELTGQTNIRQILSTLNVTIELSDGSRLSGWSAVPSTFYYIEKTGTGYVIHGGGFGHGVGMSQYGAMILADEGMDYKYILTRYYSGIEFTSIYDDDEKTDE